MDPKLARLMKDDPDGTMRALLEASTLETGGPKEDLLNAFEKASKIISSGPPKSHRVQKPDALRERLKRAEVLAYYRCNVD